VRYEETNFICIQLHRLMNCVTAILYAHVTGRFYGYAAEMDGTVCLKL